MGDSQHGNINCVVDPNPNLGLGSDDVVITGKVFGQAPPWIKYIHEAKKKGALIVQDVCDFHQLNDDSLYQVLLGLADRITTSSNFLKQEISKKYPNTPVFYIPDAPELSRGVPKQDVNAVPHILWYGQPNNLKHLLKIPLPKCTLQLITNMDRQLVSTEWNITHTPWTKRGVELALEACDFVICPVDVASPDGFSKSSNRVLEALWAGRPVICSPIPSYVELDAEIRKIYTAENTGIIFMDNEHPVEQLIDDWLYNVANPEYLGCSQDYIHNNLTIEQTSKLWAEAFKR